MFKPTTFGKYYLTERIAVGGMAEIYKAKLMGVGGFERPMVVKQILPQLARQATFVDMFIDEARIAVSLAHGNIVQVYELGRLDGTYFIAMEYVHGKDLSDILDRAFADDKFPSWELAVFVAIEILHGLDYAHRRRDESGKPLGIVHRDISPQNILLSYEGEVKITDFGIAKAMGKLAETQSGVIKGKFGYMSPEQAEGLEVDARTDIFSVGVLLYEMMTGKRLFHGRNDAESIERVREAKVPTPSLIRRGVPPGLDPIVFRALARDKRERYPDANSFQLDLSKFLFAHGQGGWPQQLASYMRDLFGDPSAEVDLPRSPKQHTSVTAATDALIDEISTEARPPVGLSTQILNAQTDALLGDLGIGSEPVNTPLPPPKAATGFTAMGRPIEKPEVMGKATQPMSAAAEEFMIGEPTRNERPDPAIRRPEDVLGIPGVADTGGPRVIVEPQTPRGGNTIWVVTIVVLLGLLGLVTWKSGLLSKHRQVEAAAPKAVPMPTVRYGTVEIGASSDNAKVLQWMCKTPCDIPHVDMGMTQELRVEKETYWAAQAAVAPSAWKDDKAQSSVELVPTASKRPQPAKISGGESPSEKYGTLHVVSQPEGADVWLLVGFTPTMHMEGLRANRDYRFEIVAEHHLPKVVELKQGDWKDDGLHLMYRADATLEEDPKDPVPVIRVKQKARGKSHTVRF